MTPPRLVPQRPFPAYAYLPGRHPHPVRDTDGHSYGLHLDRGGADDETELHWGADLFDAGFYWEAHEAWEPFWHAARRGSAERSILKGLILLAAAGLKLREGKRMAALRHGNRAARNFQTVTQNGDIVATSLREAAHALLGFAEAVIWRMPLTRLDLAATPIPVFDFNVGSVLSRVVPTLAASGGPPASQMRGT